MYGNEPAGQAGESDGKGRGAGRGGRRPTLHGTERGRPRRTHRLYVLCGEQVHQRRRSNELQSGCRNALALINELCAVRVVIRRVDIRQ
jgi:hypothetical protein